MPPSTDPPESGAANVNAQSALKAEGIAVHFEGVKALDGVDLDVAEGEIVGLIGPNGAGKTTLLNVLTGFERPTVGRVRLNTQDITRLSAFKRARKGLTRTFQGGHFFAQLTVFENVEVGAVGAGATRREARSRTRVLLERLGLTDDAETRAESLPFGAERRLEIGRALASHPRFVLLDEPAAGLNDSETDLLVERLREIPDAIGCGLLIVEHNMSLIMRVSERIQVLDHGRTLAVGTPAEIRGNAHVIAAYLGAGGPNG